MVSTEDQSAGLQNISTKESVANFLLLLNFTFNNIPS
jgi:hypothetical protein